MGAVGSRLGRPAIAPAQSGLSRALSVRALRRLSATPWATPARSSRALAFFVCLFVGWFPALARVSRLRPRAKREQDVQRRRVRRLQVLVVGAV